MKRLLCLCLTLCMLLMPMTALAADVEIHESPKPVTVHVDGYYLPSDVAPVIERGRTLIPLRAAAQAIGANVDWDQGTGSALIYKGDVTVHFTQGSDVFTRNGKSHALDVPLQNRSGRILVPLRAVAEALDVQVDWRGDTADVRIQTGAPQAPAVPVPDGTPEKLRWLIEKYYVGPDVSAPVVGSWQCLQPEGVTSPGKYYSFISALGGQRYQCVTLEYFYLRDLTPDGDLHYQAWITSAYLYDAKEADGAVVVHVDPDHQRLLYYHGPHIGLGFSGTMTYRVAADGQADVEVYTVPGAGSAGPPSTSHERYQRF